MAAPTSACASRAVAPFADQSIRNVGRHRERLAGERGHPAAIELQVLERARERFQRSQARLDDFDCSAFGDLQVAVIRERHSVHGRERTRKSADHRGRSCTHQFERIGVAFLRHQTRTGARFVSQRYVPEVRRVPDHDLFTKPRSRNERANARVREIQCRVAVADRVQSIARRRSEAERVCSDLADRTGARIRPARRSPADMRASDCARTPAKRCASRRNGSAAAHSQKASSTGCAGCQCVVAASRRARLQFVFRGCAQRRCDSGRYCVAPSRRDPRNTAAASLRLDRCGCGPRAAVRRLPARVRARARRSRREYLPHRSHARSARSPLRDFGCDRFQSAARNSLARDDAMNAARFQSRNVRFGTLHVERCEHEVFFQRGSEPQQHRIRRRAEAAAPLQRIRHVRATISSGKPCNLMNPSAA